MPNCIRSHIQYPPRQPKPVAVSKSATAFNIDAAILSGAATADIITELGVRNEDVQKRRRRLRKQGLVP